MFPGLSASRVHFFSDFCKMIILPMIHQDPHAPISIPELLSSGNFSFRAQRRWGAVQWPSFRASLGSKTEGFFFCRAVVKSPWIKGTEHNLTAYILYNVNKYNCITAIIWYNLINDMIWYDLKLCMVRLMIWDNLWRDMLETNRNDRTKKRHTILAMLVLTPYTNTHALNTYIPEN